LETVGNPELGYTFWVRPVETERDRTVGIHGSSGVFGARVFLLSEEYLYYITDNSGQRIGNPRTEIDVGRLFAEALVVVAAAGVGLVLLQRPARRQNGTS
jgi:hypothetical protein